MNIDHLQSNFVMNVLPDRILIKVNAKRSWGLFSGMLFTYIMNGLCFLPIVIYALTIYLVKNTHILVVILVGVLILVFYMALLRKKFWELIDSVFVYEAIEINNQQITVERSGFLRLKYRQRFLAENLRGITGPVLVASQTSFLSRIHFTATSLTGILVWKKKCLLNNLVVIGKSLPSSSIQQIIDEVYRKFPQYRNTSPETK